MENKSDQFLPQPFKFLNRFPSTHVPEMRLVEDLYKEDLEQSEYYRFIADNDEEIAISGNDINLGAISTWGEANFESQLYKNIVERSMYTRPRKIQSHSIPYILEGNDVKAHAETGSGKTAAFLLPIINMLMKTKMEQTNAVLSCLKPYAIIIVPTHEICNQIYDQARKFADRTGVLIGRAYGQYNILANIKELKLGCNILCCTPGRLYHFILNKLILLCNLKYLVFDEADCMLEDYFFNQISLMLKHKKFPCKKNCQTIMFSATFPKKIQKISESILKSNHIMLSTKNRELVFANNKIEQNFILVDENKKNEALLDMLQVNQESISLTLIFVNSKKIERLSLWLANQGVTSITFHSKLNQAKREESLEKFKKKEESILLTNDLCSRGIDFKNLDHIINYDLNMDEVNYIYRIGRTGRIRDGFATTFITNKCKPWFAAQLVNIVQNAGQKPPEFLERIAKNKAELFDNNIITNVKKCPRQRKKTNNN